jgi:hypothetical protein
VARDWSDFPPVEWETGTNVTWTGGLTSNTYSAADTVVSNT